MTARVSWLLQALILATVTSRALAQPSDVPAVDHAALSHRIERPVPIDTPVSYPPGAHGAGRVVLHVVIDREGHVVSAEVIEGDEPFGSAALEAARGWRFAPAQKDGRPVAAKVRFEARFEEQAAEVPSSSPPEESSGAAAAPSAIDRRPPSAPVPAGAAPAPAPQTPNRPSEGAVEVVVLGERTAPDAQSFTRAEAREIPGTFGDPLRAIEALPGITPVVSGLPYFYVRGAPPGNVGYFVDGVRIPLLWHAFVGPSVLHPSTISEVTLHRGGYPARYGRYAGAIITADTITPPARLGGETSIRVIDAGTMVSAPLSSDGTSAASVAGRYAYTGPVISAVTSRLALGYWDYQALGRYDLGSSDRLGVLVFGARDSLRITNHWDSSTEFHRIDPRFEHDFSESSSVRVAAT
jgi:TonB family protein